MTSPLLVPTSPRHKKMHDDLVRFVRIQASEWRADPSVTKGEFVRCIASELQVMAAIMARYFGSSDHHMHAAAAAWKLAELRNYTAADLVATERDVVQ